MSGVIWIALSVGFLVLEIAVSGFFFAWFAVAALVVAGGAALGLAGIASQLLVFAAVTTALVAASRTIWKDLLLRASPGDGTRTNADALPGETGVVIDRIDNGGDAGRVRLQGMEWTARSVAGGPIDVGARVRVVRVDGVKLIVEAEPSLRAAEPGQEER